MPSDFLLEIMVPVCLEEDWEAQSQSCLKSSVKFLQLWMIWGAMASAATVLHCAGVDALCFIKSFVNIVIYQHFVLPYVGKLYGGADFHFQQYLVPAHSAKTTSNWCTDHGITVLG